MDWTRCPEFTVNFRVATNQAIFAQVKIVLHADVAGFPVRVVDAVSQYHLSFIASISACYFLIISPIRSPADEKGETSGGRFKFGTDSEDNPDLYIFNGLL